MRKDLFLKQYQSKEWYDISKRIKARDNNTCQMCGCKNKPLNVHHLHYGEGGSIFVEDSSLITICEDCHKHLHDNLIDGLFEELKYSFSTLELRLIYEEILEKYGTFYTLHPKNIPSKGYVQKKYLSNLKKWRINVSKSDFINRLLNRYYSALIDKEDVSNIMSLFRKEVGVSIFDYIKQNESICRNIECDVIIAKEKEKAGFQPF